MCVEVGRVWARANFLYEAGPTLFWTSKPSLLWSSVCHKRPCSSKAPSMTVRSFSRRRPLDRRRCHRSYSFASHTHTHTHHTHPAPRRPAQRRSHASNASAEGQLRFLARVHTRCVPCLSSQAGAAALLVGARLTTSVGASSAVQRHLCQAVALFHRGVVAVISGLVVLGLSSAETLRPFLSTCSAIRSRKRSEISRPSSALAADEQSMFGRRMTTSAEPSCDRWIVDE